jgi:hypothetical protein
MQMGSTIPDQSGDGHHWIESKTDQAYKVFLSAWSSSGGATGKWA